MTCGFNYKVPLLLKKNVWWSNRCPVCHSRIGEEEKIPDELHINIVLGKSNIGGILKRKIVDINLVGDIDVYYESCEEGHKFLSRFDVDFRLKCPLCGGNLSYIADVESSENPQKGLYCSNCNMSFKISGNISKGELSKGWIGDNWFGMGIKDVFDPISHTGGQLYRVFYNKLITSRFCSLLKRYNISTQKMSRTLKYLDYNDDIAKILIILIGLSALEHSYYSFSFGTIRDYYKNRQKLQKELREDLSFRYDDRSYSTVDRSSETPFYYYRSNDIYKKAAAYHHHHPPPLLKHP